MASQRDDRAPFMDHCNSNSYQDLSDALLAYDWRDGKDTFPEKHLPKKNMSAAPSQMQLPLGGAAYPPASEVAGTFFPESTSFPALPGHGARMDNTIRAGGSGARTGASLMSRQPSQDISDVSRSAGSQLGAPMEPRMSTTNVGAPRDAAAKMLQTLQSKLTCIQEQVKNLPRTGYAARPRQAPVIQKTADNVLDEDFLALVSCQLPSQNNPRKRKADEVLNDMPGTNVPIANNTQ